MSDLTVIPIEELVHRRVYELRSRNLSVGVWNEPVKGFIGVRLKFGEEYLFTEYYADGVSPVGTARPVADLEVDIPEGVELAEYFTRCDVCRSGLEFDKETGWSHVQPLAAVVCDTPRALGLVNTALFDILKVEDNKAHERWLEETGPLPTKEDLKRLEQERKDAEYAQLMEDREVTWAEVAPELTEDDLKEI